MKPNTNRLWLLGFPMGFPGAGFMPPLAVFEEEAENSSEAVREEPEKQENPIPAIPAR